MNKKTVFIMVLSATAVLFAITAATAYNRTATTPLYTIRMEQVSSKMNFLPTAVNEFTYSAEKGYTLDCSIQGYGGVQPLKPPTESPPCETWETCDPTCPNTCIDTCPNTCPNTCETCPLTCPLTCLATCPNTCAATCPITCDGPTCPSTCDDPTCYVTSCGEVTCSEPKCGK
jgi:hypothetical protein